MSHERRSVTRTLREGVVAAKAAIFLDELCGGWVVRWNVAIWSAERG